MSLEKHLIRNLIDRYVVGMMNKQDAQEFEQLLVNSEQVMEEFGLFKKEVDYFLEQHSDMPTPPGLWDRILADVKKKYDQDSAGYSQIKPKGEFIKMHKYWRLAFIALCVIIALSLSIAIVTFIKSSGAEKKLEKIHFVKNMQ